MCFDASFIEILTGSCQNFDLLFWYFEQTMGREKIAEVCHYLFALGARLWFMSACLCACLSVCQCVPHTLPPCQKALTWWQSEMASKRLTATFPLRPVVPSSLSSTSNPRTLAPTIKRKLNDSLYCISPPTLQSENIKNKRQERAFTPLPEYI